MTIHEFGKENEKVILLIHPSVVKWDYFEYVIPLLEKDYRLIVPALPGYDFDEESDFTSVEQVAVDHCVMDGGITPYRLPWVVTRVIALKDYMMMMLGRIGGVGLLEKAFSTDEYSKEDLEYVSEVLKHCSRRTIWRTFYSCNNYKLPDPIPQINTKIHYWFAENEQKARKADIKYMKEFFPDTVFG